MGWAELSFFQFSTRRLSSSPPLTGVSRIFFPSQIRVLPQHRRSRYCLVRFSDPKVGLSLSRWRLILLFVLQLASIRTQVDHRSIGLLQLEIPSSLPNCLSSHPSLLHLGLP